MSQQWTIVDPNTPHHYMVKHNMNNAPQPSKVVHNLPQDSTSLDSKAKLPICHNSGLQFTLRINIITW